MAHDARPTKTSAKSNIEYRYLNRMKEIKKYAWIREEIAHIYINSIWYHRTYDDAYHNESETEEKNNRNKYPSKCVCIKWIKYVAITNGRDIDGKLWSESEQIK